MSLRDRINDELKNAMRAGDTRRRDGLRLLSAALKQKEVDERKTLNDDEIVGVVDKMIKQRRESIAQFEKGARPDLAEKEQFEISVLEGYMPQRLTDAEIEDAIGAAITQAGATGPGDMGKVMGSLKGKLAGHADRSAVSARVKARLARPT
jgi:uncharacterized protein YqeY